LVVLSSTTTDADIPHCHGINGLDDATMTTNGNRQVLVTMIYNKILSFPRYGM
jgi:hypothetical protein